MIFNPHILGGLQNTRSKEDSMLHGLYKMFYCRMQLKRESSLTANLFSYCPKYIRYLHFVLWLSQEKRNNEFGAIAFSPLRVAFGIRRIGLGSLFGVKHLTHTHGVGPWLQHLWGTETMALGCCSIYIHSKNAGRGLVHVPLSFRKEIPNTVITGSLLPTSPFIL